DDVAVALVIVNDFRAGANVDAAPAGAVGLHDACATVDDGPGGKVRTGNEFHQLIDGDVFIVDQRKTGLDHFADVVGRNIGGHAHGDAGRAVDQQVGNTGGQNVGDLFLAVVVVDPIDSFLVEIRQQLVGKLGHANFRVSHGGGAV